MKAGIREVGLKEKNMIEKGHPFKVITYTELGLYCWKSQGNVGQRRRRIQTQQVHRFFTNQNTLLRNQVLKQEKKSPPDL